jgi:hypothetical protein
MEEFTTIAVVFGSVLIILGEILLCMGVYFWGK